MFDLLRRGTKDRVRSATGLLSFQRLGSIGFLPSLDPTTKLLCISSIWTTVRRPLGLEGFKTLNPVRINKPIKSSPCYVYQFHLSAFLHYIIATQLPHSAKRCQNSRHTGCCAAMKGVYEKEAGDSIVASKLTVGVL
jgi:hypothetical protein